MRHVPGKFQKSVVHILGLAMALLTLWMIQSLTCNAPLTFTCVSVLLLLLALDIAAIVAQHDLAGIATGLGIFAWIVAGRWSILPNFVRKALIWLLPAVGILLLMFLNEAVYCESLLKQKPLPYHAVIEIWGLVLFVYVSAIWIKWGRMSKRCNRLRV